MLLPSNPLDSSSCKWSVDILRSSATDKKLISGLGDIYWFSAGKYSLHFIGKLPNKVVSKAKQVCKPLKKKSQNEILLGNSYFFCFFDLLIRNVSSVVWIVYRNVSSVVWIVSNFCDSDSVAPGNVSQDPGLPPSYHGNVHHDAGTTMYLSYGQCLMLTLINIFALSSSSVFTLI